jgi:fucose permease
LALPRIRVTWISFSYLAVWAYLLYGIGNATPHIRADLHLTDFEAGLHASALAVGVLTAGISADRVARKLGSAWLLDAAVLVLGAAIGFIVLAPSLLFSLAGALLLGFGGGTLGTDVNVQLSRSGGPETRKLMAQANALAMVTAIVAPLAMGVAEAGFHAWRIALLIPLLAFAVLTLVRPRESEARSSIKLPSVPLPRAYWFVWLLLVLGVSIEFSFVFWGSTIVAQRTGIYSADSTLLASFFVVGMFLSRAAIGRGFGSTQTPRGLIAAGLVVVLAGAILVWVSNITAISALGLLLGGLGTAGLGPIGLAVALQTAVKAPLQASARSTLGSGVAVLLAPSALGLAADAVGVVAAWTIIPVLALAALALIAVTPSTEPQAASAAPASPLA